MQKVRIAVVGRQKEKHWLAAEAEYIKMLRRFCDLDITELSSEPTPDDPSDAEKAAILRAEGERLKNAARGYDEVVAMAVEAKPRTSEQFAAALLPFERAGRSVCFLIGGSFGIDESLKRSASLALSLSPLTLPHRMARVILLEQLFRSYKINHGETYHK